jgi:hypothetical protein
MKRRDFGLLAGSGSAALVLRQARAQSPIPDASALTTSLTPMGAERAGNADGSIPAWTGGLVSSPTSPNQPTECDVFVNETPLCRIDASNMAQYQTLLTPGTQALITKRGNWIKLYPTHRTAAAPQYVYDNTARNLVTAKLDPRGGRLGFTGAYGGVPFPIIDTSDPLTGGAQLIWNHLTTWNGYSDYTTFSCNHIQTNGKTILSQGDFARLYYPYYDPKGSLESFDGYYSKVHLYYNAPASFEGEEQLVWHSTNVNIYPDIVWELLNGQGRVRKAPNEAYDTPDPTTNGLTNLDEITCFYGNPSEYDWRYIGKQEMLVPYNCNALSHGTQEEIFTPHFPNPELIRWEKHRVWVVEATLHPGESNVNARRRFYIDEDTWCILLGEAYDGGGTMVKYYTNYNCARPAFPATNWLASGVFLLETGDYTMVGDLSIPGHTSNLCLSAFPDSNFEAQEMAANASF